MKTAVAENLTRRESELLGHLLDGCTLSAAAEKMGISYCTANTHINNLYRKLSINSREQLFMRCAEN